MRTVAWACDRCGRMVPGEERPPWIDITTRSAIPDFPSGTWLFCSKSCVVIWARTTSASKEDEGGSVPVMATCPECSWTSTAANVTQSLRMHTARAHGGMQGNPTEMLERKRARDAARRRAARERTKAG